MKAWKKNAVAAAVLVTVCAGIYVNWLYTEEQSVANLSDTLNSDKILSSDFMVMGDETSIDLMDSTTGEIILLQFVYPARRRETVR